MLDSGVLDDSDSGRSIRDVSGRAGFVSLRGFAEAGRLVGEGEMRKQSSECKDNNAAVVKRMMPNGSWTELVRWALRWLAAPAMTGSGRQKQLDIGPSGSIIIFTDLAESFETTHGRQRCQVRGAATTGDAEPAPEGSPRRAVSSGRVFRSPR